jgi:acetate---CoA ligase (ADP-forming)
VFALKILADFSAQRCSHHAQVSQPGQPYRFRENVHPIFEQAAQAGRTMLDEDESRNALRLAGFSVPAFRRCATLEACLDAAEELTPPLVMKVSAANTTHKSDVGGIVTGIRTQEDVRSAFATIMQNVSRHAPPDEIQGVLLSEQIPPGQELLLGIKRDPLFGSFIMVGLGGIFVEVFQDVALRLAPITLDEAAAMLDELQAAPILHGIRGQAGIDRDALLDLLVRLSQLAAQCPEIQEFDINPLIALPPGQGCHVADVRVILNSLS